MTKEQIDEQIRALESVTADLLEKGPDACRQYLIDAGIIKPENNKSMKQLRLFTESDWKAGLRPTQLRDGTKLDYVHLYNDRFLGVTGRGNLISIAATGIWYEDESPNDLMIEVEETVIEYWVNVYKNDGRYSGYTHNSLSDAKDSVGGKNYQITHHITHTIGKEPKIEFIEIKK